MDLNGQLSIVLSHRDCIIWSRVCDSPWASVHIYFCLGEEITREYGRVKLSDHPQPVGGSGRRWYHNISPI